MDIRSILHNPLDGTARVDRGACLLYDKIEQSPGAVTRHCYELLAGPFGWTEEQRSRYPIDTNAQTANRLPPPQKFVAMSIHSIFNRNMAPVDFNEFRFRNVLELQIGQKIYYQAPLAAIPEAGRRIESMRLHVMGVQPRPGYFGDFPRVIPYDMHFAMRLQGDPFALSSDGIGLKLRLVLNGTMDRGVQ